MVCGVCGVWCVVWGVCGVCGVVWCGVWCVAWRVWRGVCGVACVVCGVAWRVWRGVCGVACGVWRVVCVVCKTSSLTTGPAFVSRRVDSMTGPTMCTGTFFGSPGPEPAGTAPDRNMPAPDPVINGAM